MVMPPPDPVVAHPTQKRVLGSPTGAPETGPVLAAQIAGQGECRLVDILGLRLVVVPQLHAVVAVDTLDGWQPQVIFSIPV